MMYCISFGWSGNIILTAPWYIPHLTTLQYTGSHFRIIIIHFIVIQDLGIFRLTLRIIYVGYVGYKV
jgi:hypothetical protein